MGAVPARPGERRPRRLRLLAVDRQTGRRHGRRGHPEHPAPHRARPGLRDRVRRGGGAHDQLRPVAPAAPGGGLAAGAVRLDPDVRGRHPGPAVPLVPAAPDPGRRRRHAPGAGGPGRHVGAGHRRTARPGLRDLDPQHARPAVRARAAGPRGRPRATSSARTCCATPRSRCSPCSASRSANSSRARSSPRRSTPARGSAASPWVPSTPRTSRSSRRWCCPARRRTSR